MAETENTTVPQTAPAIALVVCPYLGRRRHPAQVYTYATSSNVCYARPHRDEPYSHVERHTQMGVCLEAAEGWSQCRHFSNAVAHGVQAPRELPPQAGGVVRTKVRRRRRRRGRHWLRTIVRQGATVGAVLGGSALLGWILARWMQ